MDAVSLALPVNKIAGPTVATGDNGVLTDESGQGPVDFASLLAAGLGLQDPLLDPAKVAGIRDSRHRRERGRTVD